MIPGALAVLVRREFGRPGGALGIAGFGVLAGTFALAFFVALGLGARAVPLGEVFPLDRVEIEPEARPERGLLALLTGRAKAPRGIAPEAVERVSRLPGVARAYPKLRVAFPSGAFGDKEIIGRDAGTHELLADGVDPALVAADVKGRTRSRIRSRTAPPRAPSTPTAAHANTVSCHPMSPAASARRRCR